MTSNILSLGGGHLRVGGGGRWRGAWGLTRE